MSCTVIAEVVMPLATMEVGEAPIVEVAVEGLPTVKATTAEPGIAAPPRVAVTVALSMLVEEVRVAV